MWLLRHMCDVSIAVQSGSEQHGASSAAQPGSLRVLFNSVSLIRIRKDCGGAFEWAARPPEWPDEDAAQAQCCTTCAHSAAQPVLHELHSL